MASDNAMAVLSGVREAEEKLMLPPAPGAVPLLSLYLEEEAVIYGDDFEVITAAEAGWPEHAEKTDAEMLRRDKSWMKTASIIHFFRYNHLPDNSIRAILDGKSQPESFKYEVEKQVLRRNSMVLQNKMFGLPANTTPIAEWKWWPQFVLGSVREYDSDAYLNNLAREFKVLRIRTEASRLGQAAEVNRM